MLDLLPIPTGMGPGDVVGERAHVDGLALGRRPSRRRDLLDDHVAPSGFGRGQAINRGSQSAEGGRSLLAVGAAAVHVDLLEQTAEPAKLADGGGVGAANDGTTERTKADQLGDSDTGVAGDAAKLRLLGGRDPDVEALGQPDRSLPTERHGGLRN